jgi:hypothetical protein
MKKGISVLVLSLLLFVGLRGDSHYQYVHAWGSDLYFGHVIYPEAKHDGKDAVVLREGYSTPEVADLNLPLAPGDKIMTSERRCEIQFDTGTVIRLDRNSELKIETILAQSLSSKSGLTNLLLNQGQIYVMYKRYVRKEIFQIITPNAAVKLDHKSVAMIHVKPDGNTDVLIKEGKASMLYGPHENAIKSDMVKKSRMVRITQKHEMIQSPYEAFDDFEEWNKKINEEFMELHEGKAVVPLPIQKLPSSVFYFAQKYGSRYGEWIWDSYLGYVWRPFLNDHRSPGGGSWMPYQFGRWTSVQGQLFWVPAETWGWVPHHLGIWMWNKKKGWVWIPGSVFAPAWVDWAYYSGHFCWRAWSVTDWYAYAVYRDGYLPYYAHLIHPDDEIGLPHDSQDQGIESIRRVLGKDQLKSKKAAPYPMPKEMKDAYDRVVLAMRKGEEGMFASLNETPNHMLVVSQEDLNSPRIHEKSVRLTDLSKTKNLDLALRVPQQNPHRLARQTFNRNEKIASLRGKVAELIGDLNGMKSLEIQEFQLSKAKADPRPQNMPDQDVPQRRLQPEDPRPRVGTTSREKSGSSWGARERNAAIARERNAAPKPPRMNFKRIQSDRSVSRFRDWNPDFKAARRSGVSIQYSSRSNEVRCPELNISSRQVAGSRGYSGPRVRLTSRGSVSASGSSGAYYGGGSSSGSASSSGGGTSSNSSNSNTGAKSSGSGGQGKVVKKQL